jgi:hypothetical protein
VLCQRVLFEGRPTIRLVSTLATIFERQFDDPAGRDQYLL